jgi:hypothetical protein
MKVIFKQVEEEGTLWQCEGVGDCVQAGDYVFLPGGHEGEVTERHIDFTEGSAPTMTVIVELDDE